MNTLLKLARLCVAAGVLALSMGQPISVAHATTGATLTVNSNLDVDVNDGVCTLREAITAALNNADYHGCVNSAGTGYGDDYIQFSISSSTTISLSSPLPFLNTGGTLTINGSNSRRPIVIDGAGAHQVFDVGGSGALTLGNLTIQHASSGSTGGAIVNGGILIVLMSTFRNNAAVTDGGAIVNALGGSLNIANSTFMANSASYGGALAADGGTVTIYNSTFSGNSATTNGGAISTWNASVTNIYNSILANSTAPEDCWHGTGTLGGSHNVIETSTGFGTSTDCSSTAVSASDPKLGAAAGSPAYFPLDAGSPAIDAGDNTICLNPPVNNTSENGIPRPQDGNNDTVRTCDIGSYEKPLTKNFRSSGAADGWVLESSETSGNGGSTKDAGSTTLRLGDDAGDRQYRAILSFPTAALPDTAVIVQVTLKVRKSGSTGSGDPVALLLGFQPDVQRGYFGSSTGLESADFQFHTTATKTIGPFAPSLVSGWYSLNLTGAKAYVNKLAANGGVTQVRLKFKLDDNDNMAANYLSLYSGNAATASNRPLLSVVYYVP
jgi:CSLREA domain-containing protein